MLWGSHFFLDLTLLDRHRLTTLFLGLDDDTDPLLSLPPAVGLITLLRSVRSVFLDCVSISMINILLLFPGQAQLSPI